MSNNEVDVPIQQGDVPWDSNRSTPQENSLDLDRAVIPTDEEKEVGVDHGVEKDKNIVDWEGPDDPARPINWPFARKAAIVVTSGFMTFSVTFASSVFASTIIPTAEHFHVSSEVTTLSVGLYVLGFAFGPMIFGPLSELYGRTRPMFIGMFLFCIFQIPLAVAQNLETIFLSRFLAGTFGSAPLAIVAGMYVDFCTPQQRGVAIVVFAGAVFLGPSVGPLVGGFVTQSYLGWRWTAWITLIMSSFFSLLALIAIPETFEPVLLKWKAEKLRPQTRNWALHAKFEENPISMKDIANDYLMKPINMIMREPILILFTLYMSVVYGLLYLTFEAFPISFEGDRHWKLGISSLPYISLGLGISSACLVLLVFGRTWWTKRLIARGHVHPEDRLPPMAAGGVFLAIGLFWFAWTSHPSTHWSAQVISIYFIGLGIILIFMSAIVYLLDVYMRSSNSAIAINTFLRSALAAGFTMFAGPMYRSIGVDWGTTTLGFITVVLIPIPLLFIKYGERIRKLSKFAPSA